MAVEKLRDFHAVPVLAVHAPCLLVTQRTWGDDPRGRSWPCPAEAARRLGADTVVVHPPFRWQGTYASGFEAASGASTTTRACGSAWRTCTRAYAVRNFKAYLPSWDPSDLDLRLPDPST